MQGTNRTVSYMALGLILLLGLFVSSCTSGDDETQQGKILLEERCTECHTLSRVEGAGKSAEEWARTVERMITLGAALNSEERVILLDYLEANYAK